MKPPPKRLSDLKGGKQPAGAYDRLLDFSTPHTGTTFFAPTRPMLQKLVERVGE